MIDLNVPRRAQYLHKAWKRHQNAVYWVDINLAIEKGLKFCQTRSNAIILQETLPAYCIPKVVRLKTGESHIRKSIHVTSASTKDLLETRMEKNIWFRTCSTTRRTSWATNSKVSNRTNQFQTQIMIERSSPLLEPTQRSRQVEEKRPVPRRSIHVLFMKKLSKTIERGNPLLKQEEPKHVHLMTARVSTLKWHMIERGNRC